jgi:hypothetical protein
MALKRSGYFVVCDFCGAKSASADSGPVARKAATKDGWRKERIVKAFRGVVMDLCPGCVKRRAGKER